MGEVDAPSFAAPVVGEYLNPTLVVLHAVKIRLSISVESILNIGFLGSVKYSFSCLPT